MKIGIRRRHAGIGAAVVLGLGVILACMLGAMAWSLPARHQTARVPGLAGSVAVDFDSDGVPWIKAGSDLDAASGLGFVHARDRMFQMELMRRVGSGRLSEVVGASGLRIDSLMRTLGLRHRAEADLVLLPAHTRAMLEAYSRGVNAWIAARGRFAGPEFVLLGRPEPWTPVDCLLWGKAMTLYLSGNYRAELSRLALSRRIRPQDIPALWPAAGPSLGPQAASGQAASGQATSGQAGLARLALDLQEALPRFPENFTLPATASNEWAVDGAHSATGAPLLAGDPHLAFGMPSVWFLARVDLPGGEWVGATAPGLPFLVLGHTAHIAWTVTTSGTDTQDVFVETAIDDGHYLTPDGPKPYLTRTETIHVRGGADTVLHVRETRHGPVISDIDPQAKTGAVLAVAMAGLAPGDTAAGGLDALNQAENVASAIRAAALITSPNQNLLVADAHGIGFAVTGRVPIRRAGNGDEPVDGGSGAFDWTGFASGAQLPQVIAPASGRLVNANERMAPADFPVFLGQDWYGDWRARRIRQMLDAHPHAALQDFVTMQTDVTSSFAMQMLPVLLAVSPATPRGAQALALLRGWHGEMRRDLPQPLIFDAWAQRLALDLLDHAGVPVSLSGPRLEFLAGVLTGGDRRWCDGDCTRFLQSALDRSVADLAGAYGPDPAAWRWGRAHRAIFAHPVLGPVPVLGRLTTRSIAASGGDATVGRGAMAESASPNFDDVHGAAYRGVYDLADLDRSRFMIAPGESGNIFSTHATDFMRRWRDGATIPLGPVPTHISATLQLVPGAP